jgi:oxygen-dependent protoporphyrinogen oxidase
MVFVVQTAIVVVGAGISGLATAYRLQERLPAAEITVLERDQRVGGTAWTEERDGFRVEIGPNGFLDNKPTTVQLCRDLGLGEQLLAASESSGQNRYLFLDGKLKALPNGLWPFLTTDLLTWRGKLSLLAERWRSPRRDPTDESVAAFARRRGGWEAADVFADAMVTGIHAGDPELLSVRAAFPRLAALEAEHGGILRGIARVAKRRRLEAKARGEQASRPGRMWSFRDGLRRLMETLAGRLARPPLLGVNVRRIARSAAGWTVHGEGADHWPADAVVLACPAPQQAALLPDIDAELAARIGAIVYNRVAVVALGYPAAAVPHSLDGFGYIAPQRTRRDLLGVQWCSSIFPGRAPDGTVLLRALCGGWNRADVVSLDDDRLTEAVRAELRLALGIVDPPVFRRIVRWEQAIPQYHLGHLERVAAIEARAATHAGLFLTGNAYHGVALNDCTEQAERVAERVKVYLERAPTA